MKEYSYVEIERLAEERNKMWSCDKCPVCVFSFLHLCGMDGDKKEDCEDYVGCWQYMDLIEKVYDKMLKDGF